ELARQAPERLERQTAIERHAPGEHAVTRQMTEHDVRVGDRRLAPPTPRRGRSGQRSGRARTDAQGAAGVTPADRAAAGPYRLDVEARERERAAGDRALIGFAQ